MGEAVIDLQPTVTAASTFEDADILQDMQIGKWLRTSDNALIRDSTRSNFEVTECRVGRDSSRIGAGFTEERLLDFMNLCTTTAS